MKLSPEAQELVCAVKRAYQPSDGDRTRVLEALRGRLGDAAVLGDVMVHSAPTAHRFWSPAVKLTAAGLAVLGSALWFAWPRSSVAPPPPAESPVAAPMPPPPAAAPASVASESPTETAEPPATQPSVARQAPSRRGRDALAEEVAIMSRAETDLHGGKPEAALKALDE